jgi:hypothetical protein
MKYYEKDYEDTMSALTAALQKRDRLDEEIQRLLTRKDALEKLIESDYPYKGEYVLFEGQSPASALVNLVQPTVTQRVRGILTASKYPLTSGEINEQLKNLGEVLNERANPWALIHGICRRLVDQGFAAEVEKDGRKAWVLSTSKH